MVVYNNIGGRELQIKTAPDSLAGKGARRVRAYLRIRTREDVDEINNWVNEISGREMSMEIFTRPDPEKKENEGN